MPGMIPQKFHLPWRQILNDVRDAHAALRPAQRRHEDEGPLDIWNETKRLHQRPCLWKGRDVDVGYVLPGCRNCVEQGAVGPERWFNVKSRSVTLDAITDRNVNEQKRSHEGAIAFEHISILRNICGSIMIIQSPHGPVPEPRFWLRKSLIEQKYQAFHVRLNDLAAANGHDYIPDVS